LQLPLVAQSVHVLMQMLFVKQQGFL